METNNELLAKVDEVRTRKKVSYEVAKKALEATDYDTLEAVIYLENMKGEKFEDLKEYKDKTFDSLKRTSAETVEFAYQEKSFDAPLPVAIIGTLLLAKKPKLLAAVAAGVLAFGVDITVKRGDKETNLTKPVREKMKVTANAFGLEKTKISRKIDDLTEKIHFKKEQEEEDDLKGYFSPDIY
ncbi:MAG TPA: hypothetical protein VLM88_05235 [Proteiniclasticum sp.]|nr:hypothetical protein [Proteiniclasticum sp.]